MDVDFPRGLTSRRDLERHRFDFSFSGLKTAVARWVEAREASGEPVPVADVAASSRRRSATCSPARPSTRPRSEGIEDLLIGGGVAANSRLRALAEERAAAHGIRVRVPRPGLCTDNGAMVAALGAEMVARGRTPSALDLPADSSLPVTPSSPDRRRGGRRRLPEARVGVEASTCRVRRSTSSARRRPRPSRFAEPSSRLPDSPAGTPWPAGSGRPPRPRPERRPGSRRLLNSTTMSPVSASRITTSPSPTPSRYAGRPIVVPSGVNAPSV